MTKKKFTHMHHIIPKHAGGSDDPANLVELTVEEHAEAHRILYEKHGRWEDYCAWQALSGRIDNEEIIRLIQSSIDKTYCSSEAFKERLREGWVKRKRKGLGTPWNKGQSKENNEYLSKWSDEMKLRQAEGRLPCIGDSMRGKEFSDDHKKKLSKIAKNRKKVECEKCGKFITKQMYSRWHGAQCKS